MDLAGKLRTFQGMSGSERILITQALLLPPIIGMGFRTIGVSRTQRHLRRWAMAGLSHTPAAPTNPDTLILSARRAHAVSKRLAGIGGTCLERSMGLWALLLRRGVGVDLQVGFRSRDGRIEGHAWVEYEGQPVNESLAIARSYDVTPAPFSFDCWRAP